MSDEKLLSNDELELRWTALRQVFDKDGPSGCIAAIRAESEDSIKNQLYRLSVRKLGGGTGATSAELDGMIAIGDAGIRDQLEVAARRPDVAARWEDSANVIAYNLSANLCDCWGDGDSRSKSHFEAGLRYADQALDMRRKLKKGLGPFSMAFWVRGKHLLSLGRVVEAATAFRECVACEDALAREAGVRGDSVESFPGGLLNARAFLGLSLLRSGDLTGQTMLDEALAVLRSRSVNGEGDAKEDAQIYRDQVEESIKRN
jgi:hypothetical protein